MCNIPYYFDEVITVTAVIIIPLMGPETRLLLLKEFTTLELHVTTLLLIVYPKQLYSSFWKERQGSNQFQITVILDS